MTRVLWREMAKWGEKALSSFAVPKELLIPVLQGQMLLPIPGGLLLLWDISAFLVPGVILWPRGATRPSVPGTGPAALVPFPDK